MKNTISDFPMKTTNVVRGCDGDAVVVNVRGGDPCVPARVSDQAFPFNPGGGAGPAGIHPRGDGGTPPPLCVGEVRTSQWHSCFLIGSVCRELGWELEVQ